MSNNDDQANGKENASNVQPCCDGGSCCPSGSGGSGRSWKIVVFILIVIAAGAVLARSLVNKSNSTTGQTQQPFAAAAIQPQETSPVPSPPTATVEPEPPTAPKVEIKSPSVVSNEKKAQVPDEPASTLWGKPLASLASLNKVAAESDAVFVFLAADDQQGNQAITREIEAAAKKIQSNGSRISAFRLKKDAPDYAQLAKQVSVPCVVAMVKGRGMSVVSGGITETKLVQAFVAASRPQSGCGPAGCGPAGCGPRRAKPGPRR